MDKTGEQRRWKMRKVGVLESHAPVEMTGSLSLLRK
jgi:hypothetical protein